MPRVLVDLLSYTGTKGGMETYARELYRQFGRTGTPYDFVGFASTELMAMDTSWFPGRVLNSGITGENRFVWAYGELFEVARAARKVEADLIHCPATLGPARSKMPAVVTMHDVLYFSHPELMTTGWYTRPVRWMEKLAARNATRVLTDSHASATDIRKYLKVPSDRLDVIPLAGTSQTIEIRPDDAGSRGLILATGNRRPHKNWASLVRALALIDPTKRPRLVITGSHGDDPLRPVVDDLGIGEWVDLRRWVSAEELTDLYSRATVLAMPSFCDGFSLPALDAMMAGVPVMISDIPVYREVTGDAGLYVDPNDVQSIADAMVTAVTDHDLMARLVSAGHEQAAKFSWKKVAEQTLRSFNLALPGDGPGRMRSS